MKVLIIGAGGREHALAWKAAQSPKVEWVYVAPGNAGTAGEPRTENVPIPADDIESLVGFARERDVELTLVGPEGPLAAGIVDTFEARGLRIFGPNRAAAQLEGSKAFCKAFLTRHGIPTAAHVSFTDLRDAQAHIRDRGAPLVIKADGLAAGKGVTLAQTEEAACAAAADMLSGNAFGDAGRCIVIEDLLEGEEASFICLVDGEHVLPLASSQDHKARDDGDRGPNTGGMGAYSPAPVVTPEVHRRVMHDIIEPTVRGMAAEGRPYTGFLYAGLMVGPGGCARVLEYNCRLGDPEAQPLLMRLRSDLLALCDAALAGRLDRVRAEWDPRVALGVVMAAAGYPGAYRKGAVIHGLDWARGPDAKVFHAGTALRDGQVVTAGGRVLCACSLGATVAEAQASAYALAETITWEDVYYRRDIGYRAVQREQEGTF
ncbi:MAG: phosphoribosylamine--glycine ligase [Gammaproteobacteria bacterium]|nr:phosphoribosylamine--glycine ligase [Gammaproteobacteria bacterium]NIR85825.1 phosphoribosylamine--glycine ligase [Gammaproteobacteria bacterium]NIR90579.1 phosphoribosylamine--glycine ligase [Gammaproteobacteria bacterium]NIU06960.1 phosphoribosylamine--glycine ligase [Gammaproteobacteria bacterium]NIV53890.1 phosphoribosylamine--glycine ligase [Gammaproteobacteria bacterium]